MESALFTEVKDSGQRQEFATGSVRDTAEGKGRYDLFSPLAMARLAKHFENGAKKYGDRNWEKGQPIMRCIDSTLRHVFKHIEGQRDEDHLAAAAWNLLSVIHFEEAIQRGLLPQTLDDRPTYIYKGVTIPPLEGTIEDSLPVPAAIPLPPSGSKNGLSAWRSVASDFVFVKRWLDGVEWFNDPENPRWVPATPDTWWSAGVWAEKVHNGRYVAISVPEDFPFAE